MTETPPLQQTSILVDVMAGATVAALFCGIHAHAGSVKVQLSDILAIATIFVVTLRGFATPRLSPITLVALLTYLLYYFISALFVQLTIASTKIVQFSLVFGFLFVAFGYYRTRSSDRLLLISSVLILLDLAVNIGWHVAHGHYVGWKQLNEPKTIFTVLPLLLILLFTRFGRHWRQPLPLIAVSVAALVILLSGERKAYIFAVVTIIVWSGPLRIWRYTVVAALAVPLLWAVGAADRTGYVYRQIASFEVLLFGGNGRDTSQSQLLDESRPMTLSNAQRKFSNRLAHSMWQQRPLLGIGTGAFEIAIRETLSVPEQFRMGIHGGFYRALYENGVVGLELYITLWVAAFLCIGLTQPTTRAAGGRTLLKVKFLSAAMFLIYCSFEADKGLTVYCLCALPFLVALAPRTWMPAVHRRVFEGPAHGNRLFEHRHAT